MNLPEFLEQSQYENKKAYMRDLWEGRARGALAYNSNMPGNGKEYVYKPESDHIGEQFLAQYFQSIGQRNWNSDSAIPMFQPISRLSGGGGVLATAFGGIYNKEYNHTAPIIHSADKIESLNLNPTLKDGLIPQALEIIKYIVERTEGKIPVQMYNAGGPMDIASMVVHDIELLAGLYTHPRQVHRLLQACTDLYIEFYQAQQAIVPEWSPVITEDMYIPSGQGILCGEDWLATISAETAAEFEVPYINQISDAFGGVAIHSCGELMHQFEILKNSVKNLRGLYFNAGTTSFKSTVEAFKGTDVVLMPRWDVNKPFRFESRIDFVKKLLSLKTDDITVYLIASFPEDPIIPEEKDPGETSRVIVEYIEKIKTEKGWR